MMILNGKALPPYKEHDRPEEGRSWVNVVAGARVGIHPRPEEEGRLPFVWGREGIRDLKSQANYAPGES
jgi:hypothetical protein